MMRFFIFFLIFLVGCAGTQNYHSRYHNNKNRIAENAPFKLRSLTHSEQSLKYHLNTKIQEGEDEFSSQTLSLIWPASGIFTSPFGMRTLKHRKRMHTGIDIAAVVGTPVYASAAGRVVFSGKKKGYGKAIILKHDDIHETLYGHLSHRVVGANEIVSKNQLIGYIGRTGRVTGANLHFEMRIRGVAKDPLHFLPGPVSKRTRIRAGDDIPSSNYQVATLSEEGSKKG